MRSSDPTHHARLGKAVIRAARELAAIAERAAGLGLTPPALEPELRHWATRLLAATQPDPADPLAGTSMVAIVTVVEVDTPGISLDVLAEAITRGRPDNGALLLAHATPGVPAQPARWRIRHTTPRALPPTMPSPQCGMPLVADAALLRTATARPLPAAPSSIPTRPEVDQ